MTFSDKELDKKASPHEFRNHEDEAIYDLCASFSFAWVSTYVNEESMKTMRSYSTASPLVCS